MKELDFKGLASTLLGRAGEFLSSWLPGGKMRGREYVCGGLRGGPGDSFSVNMDTGKWAEFAGDERGGDLVSLYAAVEGIKQGEAAKRLADQINYSLGSESRSVAVAAKPREYVLAPPPTDEPGASFLHSIHHKPAAIWSYRGPAGELLFHVARYHDKEGKKLFCPWSYCPDEHRWVQKSWPAPRPLYGLNLLASRPSSPVLIVEGEKAADAARTLAGSHYVAITWPNGAKATQKADWTPIAGRRVLIWPDADAAGLSAAESIAIQLNGSCPEIKILDTEGQPDGWDAADSIADGWDWAKFVAWAKPRARVWNANSTHIQATAIVHTNGKHPATAASQVNVTVTTEDPPAKNKSQWVSWDELGIARTGSGAPIFNMDNALRVLERKSDLRDLVWFDEFHQKFLTKWRSDKVREWNDVDTLNLTSYMQRELGLTKLSDSMIQQAIIVHGHRHPRNEPRDWMETLKWDQKPRIEMFFIECFGAPDTDHSRAVGRNFWTGMVARVFKPGCQVDNMVVLEGAQGIGKTRALRAMGGNWYTEAHESVTDKDFFMILHGKLIVEIAELDAFSRAEVTRIKQVVSCTSDRYRAPYGRVAQDHPRMSVFVGTTNEQSYLKDITGGRRFWPIHCTVIDYQRILLIRESLYAEAVESFKAGSTWHEMPQSTLGEQEFRRQHDSWGEIINDYLIGKYETTIQDIASEGLKIDVAKLDVLVQRRIGGLLRHLDWDKANRSMNGTQRTVWVKKELPFDDQFS